MKRAVIFTLKMNSKPWSNKRFNSIRIIYCITFNSTLQFRTRPVWTLAWFFFFFFFFFFLVLITPTLNKSDTVKTVQIPRRLISLWFAKENAIKRLNCGALTTEREEVKSKNKGFWWPLITIVCLSKKMNCLTGINNVPCCHFGLQLFSHIHKQTKKIKRNHNKNT